MRVRFRAPALGGLLLLALLRCEDSSSRDADVAKPDSSTSDAADAGNDATAADSSVPRDAIPEASSGDPGWEPWLDSVCPRFEKATRPEYAIEPLEWKPCDGDVPGCEQVVVNWPARIVYRRVDVDEFDGKLRLTVHWDLDDIDSYKIVYDAASKPIAAWRSLSDNIDSCGGLFLRWTQAGGVMVLGKGVGGGVQVSMDDGGSIVRFAESVATIGFSLSSDVLLASDSSGNMSVRDLATWTVSDVDFGTGYDFDGDAFGSRVLLRRWGSVGTRETLHGWLWQSPTELTRLIDPGTELLYDLRTDGSTIVWVQAQSASIYDVAPGDLWTAPLVTDPADLVPQKRRAVPAMGSSVRYGTAGSGYYALVSGNLSLANDPNAIHLYRLSDARHWQLTPPAGLRAGSPLHVNEQYVWYDGRFMNGAPATIVRQRISDLGPGD